MNQKVRTVIFYKDYFEDFLQEQRSQVRKKIFWTINLFEVLPIVPEVYLKHIEGTYGLYEMRVQVRSNAFRIFCFFDAGKLVVLANGFQKKTQKTPQKEIDKALKIKIDYFDEQ